jgi:hypothetical protein
LDQCFLLGLSGQCFLSDQLNLLSQSGQLDRQRQLCLAAKQNQKLLQNLCLHL